MQDTKGERHGTPAERLLAAQKRAKAESSRPHTLFATGGWVVGCGGELQSPGCVDESGAGGLYCLDGACSGSLLFYANVVKHYQRMRGAGSTASGIQRSALIGHIDCWVTLTVRPPPPPSLQAPGRCPRGDRRRRRPLWGCPALRLGRPCRRRLHCPRRVWAGRCQVRACCACYARCARLAELLCASGC